MENKKKLLFIFAHPDDESFACGGTMAKCSSMGHELVLVCATSGCKGRCGPFSFQTREQLVAHREGELRQACHILGVSSLILYRYPDGYLKDHDLTELIGKLKDTIVDQQPDVVVTFPPDGVTGHPDHIAISEAAEQAMLLAEELLARNRLPAFYYSSIPHYYKHCADKGPDRLFPITGKVDIREFRAIKGQALQAHQSQVYSVNRAYPGVMEGDLSVIGPYEYFTLVRQHGQPVPINKDVKDIPLMELI
ncbi:PIG-L deacetylase family protein [Paenibacillus validus]|uniref:PIG-L family deacetylase n=1 Tax=Paenibacillus validus TaxID=44253 RepID=A0A7X2Z8A9_9BACL|nr:PIG-L deacetylase family protein [Paenibacillus validus]MUG70153.1 PIG-L family deacetylase [Paenibacillus validus]